jgi:hypothetical protein
MATTLADARCDVETEVRALINLADPAEPQSLAAVERAAWTQLLAVGRAVMALYLVRVAARPRPVTYEHEGRVFELQGSAKTQIGTRFGKVAFTRPVGRPAGKPRGRRDLPVDRNLGLGSAFSVPMTLILMRLCAQLSFSTARSTFQSLFEWVPSSRTVLRMVDSMGEHAAKFLAQAKAPEDDGEILVIQPDAKGIPMIGSAELKRRKQRRRAPDQTTKRHARRRRRREMPRRRRKPGDKTKNAKMVVVGVIYTMRKMDDGTLEGPINKRVIATMGGHRALFKLLHREAIKRGYGQKRTEFLADGAKVLWELKDEFFPEAEGCIDWCHIAEKLWACGECLFRKDQEARAAWVGQQTRLLRQRGAGPVVTNLQQAYERVPKTGPGTKHRRGRLLKTIKHLLNHMPHMQYARLRRDDLEIGTGVIEGAIRNVVGVRFDGPGMRWSSARAQRLLNLRCILINGQWEEFEKYVTERDGVPNMVRFAPRPAHTVPHDAKPKSSKKAA